MPRAHKRKRSSKSRLRAFLCHSSGDKTLVRELYARLQSAGIEPWLDDVNLLPGQDWRLEIRRAIHSSDVVIICLSRSAVGKTGFVQKEIKQALDAADEHPEGAIYIIPAKFDDCPLPDRLASFQSVNLYEEQGYEKLLFALVPRRRAVGILKNQSDAEMNTETVRITRIRNNGKNWHGPIGPVARLDIWIKYSGKSQLFIDSVRLYHLETTLMSAASGTFPPSHRYKIEYEPGGIIDKDLDPPLLINPSDQAEIHFELELSPTGTVGGWSCCVVFLSTRTSEGGSAKVPLLSPRPADLVLARVLGQPLVVDLAALFEDGFYYALIVPAELRRGRNFYRVEPDGSTSTLLHTTGSRSAVRETVIDSKRVQERIHSIISIDLDHSEPDVTAIGAILLLARYGDLTIEPTLTELIEHSASAAKRNAARSVLAELRKEDLVTFELDEES